MIVVDPPSILAAREHLARARELCHSQPITAAWHLANARLFRCDWPDSKRANEIRNDLAIAAMSLAAANPGFAIEHIDDADHLLAEIYQHQTGATT